MQRIAMISLHGDPTAAVGYEGAGGQNVYVRELARHLGANGVTVDVFTERLGGSAVSVEKFAPGCRVLRLPLEKPREIGRHAFRTSLPVFLNRLLRLWPDLPRYDLIHSHYWLGGWIGLRLASRAGLPLVHTSHSLARMKAAAGFAVPDEAERIATEESLARQSFLVATNREEERQLRRLYRARTLAIVPCGFDPAKFRPLDKDHWRKALGIAAGQRMILYVGRFDPNKGIEELVRAVEVLCRGWNVRLCLVGGVLPNSSDKAEYERVQSIVRDLKLQSAVKFIGAVDHSQLAQYYSAADVTVIPSHYETFGLVALEAMACGSPSVATRTGGLACTIQDGVNGLLVAPGDVSGLVEAISRILLRPEFGRHMAMAGFDKAISGFTWPIVAGKMIQVYEHAIGRLASTRLAHCP
ncbi:MAG: glycosyltransferase [Cyanobacteria bacterium REEB65]|nr:glycosyltransferase [Cyanobacteria bacterium REEB65]